MLARWTPSDEYERAFETEAPDYRWGKSSRTMLESWSDFVAQVAADGYNDIVDEYFFDMQLRDILQELIDSPKLKRFPEQKDFESAVGEIDDVLKPHLISELAWPWNLKDPPWWMTQIPNSGGPYYYEDLPEAFRKYVSVRHV